MDVNNEKKDAIQDDKETKRHKEKLEQIRSAKTKAELPSASLSSITRFIANKSSIEGVKITQSDLKQVLKVITDYQAVWVIEVKAAYFDVLRIKFPGKTEEEYNKMFKAIFTSPQIMHYLNENSARNAKLAEFRERDELEAHKQTMKQIKQAFEIKDLPKIGVGTLNGKIMKATKNDFIPRFSIEQIRTISEMLLSGEYSEEDSQIKLLGEYSEEDIEQQIYKFCESYGLSQEDTDLMYDQVVGGFFLDKTIGYTVVEIKEKEKRVLQIYKMDHEEVMEQIRDATRIAEMPKDLTDYVITSYLCGNSTIYPNGDKISTTDFKEVTDLLLQGEDFNSYSVEEALRTIAAKYYPEKTEEALKLLKEKLGKLPRTHYLVEEVNASNQKQAELIKGHASNVNVYFIPNPRSPIDGGQFFNVYTNYGEMLDLNEVLPKDFLDMDYGVPEGIDNIDAMTWWLQEYVDRTFLLRGGVILRQDENIGGVNTFRPSGGPIGITPEEATRNKKYAALSDEVEALLQAQEEMQKQYEQFQNSINQRLRAVKDKLKDINDSEKDEKDETKAASSEQSVHSEPGL